MESYSIKEWVTILSPIILVFIAGYIALKNQKKTIKLQANNKWKEDFRVYVSDYLESYVMNNFSFNHLRIDMDKKKPVDERAVKSITIMSQTIGRFNKIEMMLDKNDPKSKELIKLFDEEQIILKKLLNGEMKGVKLDTHLNSFSSLAKEIHDSK